MNEPSIVYVPQLDIVDYANSSIGYISEHFPAFFAVMKSIVGFMVGISFPLSVVFIIGIIISVERIKKIRRKEKQFYEAKVEPAYEDTKSPDPELGNRWRKVLEHIESSNQNDWRQAIMEADIILDDIVTKMGYRGEGIGEKLKSVDRADFQTLDQAWEAHRVRNQIAHEGASFPLGQHEAKRVISLYRQVFEEFFYI